MITVGVWIKKSCESTEGCQCCVSDAVFRDLRSAGKSGDDSLVREAQMVCRQQASRDKKDNGPSDDRAIGDSWSEMMRLVETWERTERCACTVWYGWERNRRLRERTLRSRGCTELRNRVALGPSLTYLDNFSTQQGNGFLLILALSQNYGLWPVTDGRSLTKVLRPFADLLTAYTSYKLPTLCPTTIFYSRLRQFIAT